MPFRVYTVNQRYVKNKRGDIGVYKKKIKKWIKSSKPYKAKKRGLEKNLSILPDLDFWIFITEGSNKS